MSGPVESTPGLTVADGPATSEPSPRRADAPVGTHIGRYLVIDEIGAGGMGRVFRAYDPKLSREVAVKRLRMRDRGGATGHARMLREAKAMAQLAHPNVVPVYDVDVDEGALFIAMEYVDGVTLKAWLRETARPWPTVVDLFMGAGAGLAAAHAQGIVHRDFKPANVIVGADGRVRVMDFGLARSVEGGPRSGDDGDVVDDLDNSEDAQSSATNADLGAALTEHGTVVGTPLYMAPEQHIGSHTDARTDQYAFCTALWEALYGATPFSGDGIADLVIAKRGALPRPPVGTKVPSALHAILARGLAYEPGKRWPSMDTLLAAIRKASARRRPWLAIVPLGVVVGALGIAIFDRDRPCEQGAQEIAGTWGDDTRETVHAALLGSSARYAEATWERIAPALDAYALDWAAMHRDACEAVKVRHEQSDEALDLRMQCLAARKGELAAVVELLGRGEDGTTENATELVAGLSPLSRCADLATLRDRLPPPGRAEDVASVRAQLEQARLEARAGGLETAIATAQKAQQTALGLDYPPVRAEADLRLGVLLATVDRIDEAQPLLERAMDTALSHRQAHTAADAAVQLTRLLVNEQSRAEESQWLAKVALGLAEGDGTDPLLIADAMLSVGYIFADRNLELEAEPYFRGAVERLEGALGPEHPDLVGPLLSWSSLLDVMDREDEAEVVARRALGIAETAFGPDHPETANALKRLAWLFMIDRRFAESEAAFDRALAIYEAAFGPDHPLVYGTLSTRASALAEQKRYDEAAASLQESLRRMDERLPEDHRSRASALHNLARVYSLQGDHARSAATFRRANEIRVRLGIRGDLTAGLGSLGQELVELGRLDEAERAFEEAFRLNVELHADDGNRSGMALIQLGKIARTRGDDAKALEQLEAAWEIERDGDDDLVKVEAAFELGRTLSELGKEPARARRLVETARAAFATEDYGESGRPLKLALDAWLAAHPPSLAAGG
ncbi:MAG TPA: serine/threonine-protein kinase [Nannocystaceae bacterium]|nr:serine/threonine-protein kinase [Nannocystaceae bacterium]